MAASYENHFERIENKSILISDLIEQILLVEEVIRRHRDAGTSGPEFDQYLDRKERFRNELNNHLGSVDLILIDRQAA